MSSLLPVVLLALFGWWSGTLHLGVRFAPAVAGEVAVLTLVAWGARNGRESLRPWAGWWWAPAAFWTVGMVSWMASPVPRAGRLFVLLAPAYLALPAAVAGCWKDERSKRRGLWGVAVLVSATAAWGMGEALVRGVDRAAMPVGHHLPLGVWLVTLFPLCLAPLTAGWARGWLSGLLALVVVVAIVDTRSVAALAGLMVAVAVLTRGRTRWAWTGAVLLGGLATQAGRLERLTQGADPSLLARWGYWQAGWRGWSERPLLGWGPGSVPWTLAGQLRPRPGVQPPGEVVGDLHALPLQVGWELGAIGVVLALLMVAGLVRGVGDRRSEGVARSGLAGVAGGLVAACGGGIQGALAPWIALGVAAGTAAAPGELGERGRRSILPLAYAMGAALLLAPSEVARLHYQRAAEAGQGSRARSELDAAVSWDPRFPLYRARRAWLDAARGQGSVGAAEDAREAAVEARGVAALWLAAGELGSEARVGWATGALEQAVRLAPLDPLAPFLLAQADPSGPAASRWTARALLGEPQLAAATLWERHPGLLARGGRTIEGLGGVDAGWRQALVERLAGLPDDRGELARLAVEADRSPATAFSLHAFRRSPWRTDLVAVEVRREAAERMDLPPAAALRSTDPEVFYRILPFPPAGPLSASDLNPPPGRE